MVNSGGSGNSMSDLRGYALVSCSDSRHSECAVIEKKIRSLDGSIYDTYQTSFNLAGSTYCIAVKMRGSKDTLENVEKQIKRVHDEATGLRVAELQMYIER